MDRPVGLIDITFWGIQVASFVWLDPKWWAACLIVCSIAKNLHC